MIALLFFGLIVTILIMNATKNPRFMNGIAQSFGQSSEKVSLSSRRYTEAEKEQQKKVVAGFWTRLDDSTSNPRVRDRIELKENGIVWRVIATMYRLPSTASASLYTIEYAYCNPFGLEGTDTSISVHEYSVIRQSQVFGADSCYNPGQINTIVGLRLLDTSTLEFNGQRYHRYDSTDLSLFFPPHLIDLIDKLNVRQCSATTNPVRLIREALITDMQLPALSQEQRTISETEQLTRTYYWPYCFTTLKENLFVVEKKGRYPLAVKATMTWNGSLENVSVSVKGGLTRRNKIEKSMTDEIQLWKFPALKKVGDPTTFEFKDTVVVQ